MQFAYACKDCDFDVCVGCADAKLPKQIIHHTHNKHFLTFLPRLNYSCDVCSLIVKFAYACNDCDFDVCARCAELPKQIIHHSHDKHPLTLVQHLSNHSCDVCRGDVKFAYTCYDCDFDVCISCTELPK